MLQALNPASATDVYVCLRLFAADLLFSAVIRSDDGEKFRCKISNSYINVDVKSSVDTIVRIDSDSPPGIYTVSQKHPRCFLNELITRESIIEFS